MKPENNQPVNGSLSSQELANNAPPLNPQTPENPLSAGSQVPQMFQQDTNPPQNSLQAFPPQKKRLPKFPKRLAALLATLLFFSLAAGAAWYFFFKPIDPDVLFKKALENSFSTQSFQIDTYSNQGGYQTSSTTKIDSSNNKEPIISSTYTDEYDQLETTIESYATKSKSYTKYSSNDASNLYELEPVNNKWVQTGKDGIDQSQSFSTYYYGTKSMSNPESAILGYLIHGNFEPTEKTNFVNFVIDNDLYSYKSDNVYKRTLSKKEVFVFEADVNENKLRDLNKEVAKVIGFNEDKVDPILASISNGTKLKIYINPADKRIVKLDIENAGTTTEISYSVFNTTKVNEEPTAEVSYEEYQNLFGSYLSSYDDVYDDGDESYDDIERKTDINALASHLEAYNAQYGRYPTIANLNNPEFRAEHMPGLDKEYLRNPTSESTTVLSGAGDDEYVYTYDASPAECDNDGMGDCLQYVLSAKLDDGSVYEKVSLN